MQKTPVNFTEKFLKEEGRLPGGAPVLSADFASLRLKDSEGILLNRREIAAYAGLFKNSVYAMFSKLDPDAKRQGATILFSLHDVDRALMRWFKPFTYYLRYVDMPKILKISRQYYWITRHIYRPRLVRFGARQYLTLEDAAATVQHMGQASRVGPEAFHFAKPSASESPGQEGLSRRAGEDRHVFLWGG